MSHGPMRPGVLARKGPPESRTVDQVIKDFSETIGSVIEGRPTVDKGPKEEDTTDAKKGIKRTVLEYGADGSALDIGGHLLEGRGITLGNVVKPKGTKDKWILHYVSAVDSKTGDVELTDFCANNGMICTTR